MFIYMAPYHRSVRELDLLFEQKARSRSSNMFLLWYWLLQGSVKKNIVLCIDELERGLRDAVNFRPHILSDISSNNRITDV